MSVDPWQVITDLASVLYRGGQDAGDVRREALGVLERNGISFGKALPVAPAPELADPVAVEGVLCRDYPAVVAAMQATLDRRQVVVLRVIDERDDLCEQLGVLQDRIGNLAAGLKLSADASRPSKKSEIEDGCAAALLGILDPR